MRADIEVECKEPQLIIDSIKPDMEKTGKFDAELKAEEGKIRLSVRAKDITGLLARINSYLRLIRISEEVQKND